ncbi:MAG: hypothetical protein BWZ10_02042 [candidate division BRC1 bacterium ADurb.BinA364]|nr:MAG: hypothetical protein BWZ10_02042 [candidate division BRC1 bacterium ADurb.BinA364]
MDFEFAQAREHLLLLAAAGGGVLGDRSRHGYGFGQRGRAPNGAVSRFGGFEFFQGAGQFSMSVFDLLDEPGFFLAQIPCLPAHAADGFQRGEPFLHFAGSSRCDARLRPDAGPFAEERLALLGQRAGVFFEFRDLFLGFVAIEFVLRCFCHSIGFGAHAIGHGVGTLDPQLVSLGKAVFGIVFARLVADIQRIEPGLANQAPARVPLFAGILQVGLQRDVAGLGESPRLGFQFFDFGPLLFDFGFAGGLAHVQFGKTRFELADSFGDRHGERF